MFPFSLWSETVLKSCCSIYTSHKLLRLGLGCNGIVRAYPCPHQSNNQGVFGLLHSTRWFSSEGQEGQNPQPSWSLLPLHWPEVRGLCWGWEQGQARSPELSVQCREAEKVSPWAGCATDEPAADLPVMAEIQRLHGFVGSVISELREKEGTRMPTRKSLNPPSVGIKNSFHVASVVCYSPENGCFTAVGYPCLVPHIPNCKWNNLNQCSTTTHNPQILAQSYYSGERLKTVALSKVHFPLMCNFSFFSTFVLNVVFTYLKCLSFNISVLSAFTINNLKTIPCQWMYRVLREYQNYIIWKTM